jgi:hypothetical protein
MLYFSFGMVDNAQETGNTGLSFTGNVGMQKRFGRWETSADFSYAQNVQTLIAIYTTNAISYGGFLRRKTSDYSYWSVAYRGTHSGLLQDEGSSSLYNMYSSTFGWRRYTFTGNYTKSDGRTLLTPAGFVNPTPLPGNIADNLILFNGNAYSVGAGASPLRRMSVTFNFRGRTVTCCQLRCNRSTIRSVLHPTDYTLRKLVLRAGYSRAYQIISFVNDTATTENTYFFSVSRWFDVF